MCLLSRSSCNTDLRTLHSLSRTFYSQHLGYAQVPFFIRVFPYTPNLLFTFLLLTFVFPFRISSNYIIRYTVPSNPSPTRDKDYSMPYKNLNHQLPTTPLQLQTATPTKTKVCLKTHTTSPLLNNTMFLHVLSKEVRTFLDSPSTIHQLPLYFFECRLTLSP